MRLFIILLALLALCSGCIQGSPAGGETATTQLTVLPRDERAGNDTPVYASEEACDAKTDKYKDLCYINTASNLKDTSVCDKIQKVQTRELCYGRVGVATGDKRLCDRISDRSTRGQCLLAIEQIGS